MRKLSDAIEARLRALTAKVDAMGLEEPTFRCHWCLDVGYVETDRFKHFGIEYTSAKACRHCDTGRAIGSHESDACKRERERLRIVKAGKVLATIETSVDDEEVPF